MLISIIDQTVKIVSITNIFLAEHKPRVVHTFLGKSEARFPYKIDLNSHDIKSATAA